MKIRTKVDVTYNSGIAGSETGIVEGFLGSAGWTDGTFNTVGANYTYATPEGQVINNGGFTVSGENIETLYTAIEPSIPTDQDHRTTEMTKYYLAFVVEMAQTFGINTSDIEIVS